MACDSLPTDSATSHKTAIEIQGDVLKALENKLPKALAADCGYNESSIVSKWKDGTSGVPLVHLGAFLHSLGLKVVPLQSRCVDVGMLTALESLAGESLRRGIVLKTAL